MLQVLQQSPLLQGCLQSQVLHQQLFLLQGHLQTQSVQVAGGSSVPNPLSQGAAGIDMIAKQIIDKIQEDSAKTRSTMAKGGRKTRSTMTKDGW